tara:strand:+ start:280 stop:477 length:198 start_codon:yes stop_codon:yes gene_type:complete
MENISNFFEGLVKKFTEDGETEKTESTTEGFLNQFDFNQTCLLLTLLFVIIFMYKKEIMKMLNLK